MGQFISGPVTFKETKSWESSSFVAAASSMQGWRIRMEDAFSCSLGLNSDPNMAYVAVFDGHGGTQIADYAAEHLIDKIMEQPEFGKRLFVAVFIGRHYLPFGCFR